MSDLFEISLRWQDGAVQVLIISGALLIGLWIMSKIELPDRGDSPREREGK